jgi:hypothetical protein
MAEGVIACKDGKRLPLNRTRGAAGCIQTVRPANYRTIAARFILPLDEAPGGYRTFRDKRDGCIKVVFEAIRLSMGSEYPPAAASPGAMKGAPSAAPVYRVTGLYGAADAISAKNPQRHGQFQHRGRMNEYRHEKANTKQKEAIESTGGSLRSGFKR